MIAWLGYGRGEHAPGRRSDRDALAAAHHVLLSHGRAVEVIRRDRPDAQVGITIDVIPIHPLTAAEDDLVATCEEDGFRNRWFLDPVLRGATPRTWLRRFARILPTIEDGDLEAISAPIDFLGVNYYRRHVVKAGANGSGPTVVEAQGGEYTVMGWEVYPDGLYELLVRLHEDYDPPPLYVTENGAAFGDTRRNGTVDDPERASYLERHLAAVARAIAAGVPVDGLLRLVAPRQLRVGPGLYAPLRARLRRLRDARAGPEAELPLVPRLHRRAARAFRAFDLVAWPAGLDGVPSRPSPAESQAER